MSNTGISLVPRDVEYAGLIADPNRFDGVRIRAVGRLSWMFEGRTFANAWVESPDTDWPMGVYFVEVVGVWKSVEGHPYGHMGISKAKLEVERMRVVEPGAGTAITVHDLNAREWREGEPLDVTGELRVCSSGSSFGQVRVFQPFTRLAPKSPPIHSPFVVTARARGAMRSGGYFNVESFELLSERRAVEAPPLTVAEIGGHFEGLAVVDGPIRMGDFWPSFAGKMLVLPQYIASRFSTSSKFSVKKQAVDGSDHWVTPVWVAHWKHRLKNGPIHARVHCSVDRFRVFCWRLELPGEVITPETPIKE